MQQLMTGMIHGNTIVLDGPPGVPEGQHVEVIVRIAAPLPAGGEEHQPASDESGFVYTEEDDRILEEIYRARHFTTRRDIEP